MCLARLNKVHGELLYYPRRRQQPWAAVLAAASGSTNVKVLVKVLKTSLFPNLITDLIHLWYDYTYWSKILRSTIPTILGHVKVKVANLKVFRTSLLFFFWLTSASSGELSCVSTGLVLFLHEKIYCGYSLKYLLSRRNKKTLKKKHLIWSYDINATIMMRIPGPNVLVFFLLFFCCSISQSYEVTSHLYAIIILINPCPAEPGYTLPLQTV